MFKCKLIEGLLRNDKIRIIFHLFELILKTQIFGLIMARYFIEMAYNGANYHGWQIQPNAVTVQEKLVDALHKALGQLVEVVGAGRTDSGVHASYYVAHFDFESKSLDTVFLVMKLNRILFQDIVVYTITQVADDSHARFDANLRTYHYYIIENKNPFKNSTSYRPSSKLDFDMMNQACTILFNYNDFTSFAKLHGDANNNICTIHRAQWIKVEDQWVFVISANRFLRNMVRAIVGTLLEVGRGKLTTDGFSEVIERKSRCSAGTSVPANALFLTDICYPDAVFKSEIKKPLL